MRSEQINSLRKGNSKLLFEFVNQYKDDISSLLAAMHLNKKNHNKVSDTDFLQICSNAIINILKDLKNAPSGFNFRSWLLKTIYKNQYSKLKKEEPKKTTKTWKSFSVFKTNIDQNILLPKIYDLPLDQRLALWASCHENMSLDEASNFFDLEKDEYLEILIQGMQGVRSRFPSKTNKIPDNINYSALITNIYNKLSTSERIELENDLEKHKVKRKFHDSLNKEKESLSKIYKRSTPGKDLLAEIRANTRLVKKRILPYLLISAELLIFLFLIFIIFYITSQIAPPKVSVIVEKGFVTITPVEDNKEQRQIRSDETSDKSKINNVNIGDIIETKAFSSASFSINDSNSLQLGSNSKIEVLKQTSKYPVSMKLIRGIAYLEIVNSDEKTRIVTNNSDFSTNGGEFLIEVGSDLDKVLVFEGEIEIIAPNIDESNASFKKNNGFSINASNVVKPIQNILIQKRVNTDKYYFSIENAKRLYFDKNNKLKVTFHWLNSKDYPFEINNNPVYVIEKLEAFYSKYSVLNSKLDKLKEAHNRARAVVEKMYSNIRKIEKQYNLKIKESDLILLNQAELEDLYLEFQKVKNNCSLLKESGYSNITFTDFSHNQKRFYSKEDEHWQAEIKKLRNSSLELSTFETIKKGLDLDLAKIKDEKTTIETELRKLTSDFNNAKQVIQAIEDSKLAREKSLTEIDNLDNTLDDLKEKETVTEYTLIELNRKLESLNNSINYVENINKQLNEYNDSLTKAQSELNAEEAKRIDIQDKIKVEETKIDNSNKALSVLKSDKERYDSELKQIEQEIEDTTNLFNAGLKERSKTTEKLNGLKKQVALIDLKLKELETKETENNNEISKKEKLIETQNTVISRYKEQIEGFKKEIEAFQKVIEDNNNKLEDYKTKITDFISDKEAKNKLLEEQKSLVVTAEKSISEANTALDEYKEKLIHLNDVKNTTTKLYNEYKKKYEISESKFNEVESSHKELTDNLKSTSKKLEESDENISKFTSDKSSIESEIVKLKDQKAKSIEIISEVKTEIFNIEKRLLSNIIFCKASKSKTLFDYALNITKIIRQKSILKSTNDKISMLEKVITTLNDKISKEETCISDYKETISKLNKDIDKVSKTKKDLMLKLDMSKKDLAVYSKQLTDLDTQIEDFKSKETEATKTIELRKKSLKYIKDGISNLKEEVKKIDENIIKLEGEKTTLSESANNAEENMKNKELLKSNIQKKLDKFLQVSQKTSSDLEDLNKKHDSIKKDKDNLLREKSGYTDQLDSVEKTLKTQKEEIFNHQSKLNELKNKKADTEELASPINTKYSTLENVIRISNQNIDKLKTEQNNTSDQINEIKEKIKTLNNSIETQSNLLKKNKPLTDLKTELIALKSAISEQQNSINKFKKQINDTENQINDHKLVIANADNLLKTEKQAITKQKDLEEKLLAKKQQLKEINNKLSKTNEKYSEIQSKIDDLKKQLEILGIYEKYSGFWTQFYNAIIKVETALQLSAFKYENLEKRIKTLETEVGEQVYLNKLSEIRATKAKLNELIKKYKVEDKKFWYIVQVLNSAEGNAPGSITNMINELVYKSAEEFLPMLNDYENLKLDKETKIKIISEALFLYPDYHNVGSSFINTERISQINDTWRIKLMKIFEQTNMFEQVDSLTEENMKHTR